MPKAIDERKERFAILRRIIQQEETKSSQIDRNKLVAKLCLETGLSRRTAREYVQILIDAEKIKIARTSSAL